MATKKLLSHLKHVEKHLDEEEEAKDDKHGDGKDCAGRQQPLLLVPHGVEEEQTELLD